MSSQTAANWDMTPFFPAPASDEYGGFARRLRSDIDSLGQRARSLPALGDGAGKADRDTWIELLQELEQVDARLSHLSTYLVCLGAADSTDEWAKSETARMAMTRAERDKVYVAVKDGLGRADAGAFAELLADPRLAEVVHYVRRLRERARQSMAPAQEELAADLGVDGIEAWGRLYDQLSATLSFELDTGHGERTVPVAMTRSFLESGDSDLRARALEGANRAWESVADSLAAALNAISGTRLSLYRRRGAQHFLDPATFDAAISRRTLDSMLDAVAERREISWRYYRLKARQLDMDRLRFCDLMAPPAAADSGGDIPWQGAKSTVLEAFSPYPALHRFARAAFDGQWIDHDPRPGKRPGAFCTTSPVLRQSRVFMTYNRTSGDVQTLAHELGHAFHGSVMKNMRYWATTYPMTLAETASTFAEALVSKALLEAAATDRARLAILDERLSKAGTFLCNIPMRFAFEHALYQERQHGELSVNRLCELMRDAQLQCYGDSLDPNALDPWFWASKLHFYITELSFYNFPYTFGFLFSMGIFARYREQGESFLPVYEELLAATASAPAEEVARSILGVDLETPDFWHQSIDLIEADLTSYERLLGT